VLCIRQPQFLQSDSCSAPRNFVNAAVWKEPIEDGLFNFLASKASGERSAYNTTAFADDRQVIILRRMLAEKGLFGQPAELHELAPLSRPEFSFGSHPLFGASGDRSIHIVATEHQMIADGNSPQRLLRADVHKREVRGTSADVDDKHEL